MSQSELISETKKLNFESFRPKLGSPWADKLKPFIESEEMWNIMQKIKGDSLKEEIVPKSSDTFRAFSTTNPILIDAIFYMMDPYPRKYPNGIPQATGIALDCSNSPDGKLQPSLINWYDAISKSEGKKVEYCPSLQYLHSQGIMLLNTDLTCKLGKTGSHEGLWDPFQKYILEEVLGNRADIIYVLCGKGSQRMKKYINPFCKIFELEHPAAAAHKGTEWDYKDIFQKISIIVKENKRYKIFWDKKDWEEKGLPF